MSEITSERTTQRSARANGPQCEVDFIQFLLKRDSIDEEEEEREGNWSKAGKKEEEKSAKAKIVDTPEVVTHSYASTPNEPFYRPRRWEASAFALLDLSPLILGSDS